MKEPENQTSDLEKKPKPNTPRKNPNKTPPITTLTPKKNIKYNPTSQ